MRNTLAIADKLQGRGTGSQVLTSGRTEAADHTQTVRENESLVTPLPYRFRGKRMSNHATVTA
ncbi:hypothetical protein GCM10011374_34740 [Kocuria dechangensis]|uniref:Uncharacterized protein n=1 Tax=Kocuria dechangensis TaxID=1176249 RepID=A0A917LYP3_9MICC|nr:hypothetical protein GCM10011374_34740 [Kocuria dechangensis]